MQFPWFAYTARLALGHGSHFGSQVVLALFDAFAALETGIADDVQGAAGSLGHLSHQTLDGLVAVLDELLVQQADFLVVLLDLTVNDLVHDLLGLADSRAFTR